MKIITPRAYIFFGEGQFTGKSHQVNPNGGQPQDVPDWLKECSAFKRLTQTGEIQQIEIKPAAETDAAPAESDEIVDGKVAAKPRMPRLPKKDPGTAAAATAAPPSNSAPTGETGPAGSAAAAATAPPSPTGLGGVAGGIPKTE